MKNPELNTNSRSGGSFLPGLVLLAGAVAILGSLTCSSTPDTAVVAMRGWSLTGDQVASEYDRLHKAVPFDTLSAAKREAFARTLVDREILLRLARKQCPEPSGPRARAYRVTAEKSLLREYILNLRNRLVLSPEAVARDLPRICREVRVNQLLVRDSAKAEQAAAALKAGQKIEEVAKQYSDTPPGPGQPASALRERTVRIDDRQVVPPIVKEALLRDLPPGSVIDPLKTQEGTLFLQVLEYRPIPQANDTAWVSQARQVLKSLAWMDRSAQWNDSLRAASGLAFHAEAYPIVLERFSAFWDSIEALRSQGITYDFAGIRAPLWRFSAEEKSRPLYEMSGQTGTVGDFVESLNGVELDLWPTSTVPEKLGQQIESRVGRMLIEKAAKKEGFAESETMRRVLAPAREKALLEEYYAVATATVPEPAPDSLRAAYERSRAQLPFPQMLSFSALAFPENQEAVARAVSAKLHAGGSWEELARAAEQENGAWYLPRSHPRDPALPPYLPEWTDYWGVAVRQPPNEISDLRRGATSQWYLVRTLERTPARERTFDEARPILVQKMRSAAQDQAIERIIEEQRLKRKVQVWPERLAAWKRSAATPAR